jgi:hypothetical protein
MPNPLEDVARGLRVIGERLSAGGEAPEWLADQLSDALRKPEPALSLAALQAELDSLTGLVTVKEQVRALVAFLQVQAERERHGLPEVATSQHLVFLGNPGTGALNGIGAQRLSSEAQKTARPSVPSRSNSCAK